MNINQKSLDHNFYGKTIGTFTELESKLFELDLLMSMTLMSHKMFGGDEKKLEKIINEMGDNRLSICCKLLGYYPEELTDNVSIKTFLNEIEKSDYGFLKFLKDQQENSKLIPKEDMEEIRNIIKENSVEEVPSYTWN
jgi:predicted esterase YcpF (UPF0227 family)